METTKDYEILEARIIKLEERIIILEQQISDLAEFMSEAIYNFIPSPNVNNSEEDFDEE